jgi:glycosyltransferase involved in cell wall biosynthesis
MSRLSVIVTSYNIEGYIGQCLESVCGQTLRDIEIIVVDDGSSDATPQIIEEFAARDSRVRPVLFTENTIGGVASAANAGLERASSPYVGFVDGDDYCEPTMFAALLEAAEHYDSDLAMCRYAVVDSQTGEHAEPADEYRWADIDRPYYALGVDDRKRFLQFVAVPWRKIYRRSMLDEAGIRFPVGDYFFEDNPFHWFSLLTARSLAVVPEVLCYHRVARLGQTMATVDEQLFRIFLHHATIREWITSHGLAVDYGASLLLWVISQMEWIAPRTPDDLRGELYAILRDIVSQYDERTIEKALTEGSKGGTGRSLTLALAHGNYAGFVKTLDLGGHPTNPLVSARYHLQYSGVGETARLAGKYLSERYTDRQRSRRAPVQAPSVSADVLFGLVLVERRLAALEDEVRAVKSMLPRPEVPEDVS